MRGTRGAAVAATAALPTATTGTRMGDRGRRRASIALIVLGALSAGCGGGAPPPQVVDLAGLEAALQARRGRGALVNIWATNCVACLEEMPGLVEVGRELAAQGGAVIFVSQDVVQPDATVADALPRVSAVASRFGIADPVLVYDAPDLDALNERFGLPGPIPSTIALDASGEQVDRHLGAASVERLREMMRAALGQD